ncbi:protein of unassigned function [Methylobacterium oryzae CBMB20]|uniref:Protein of unassigned function n=1 Tax=Methylobacterium oryzae CBMB20 TaxID=693986 RepID=A0A089QCJ9_9HYPH|nr:protein of unassigned function [Methylobacterium oryzae CBMB20]
MWSQSRRCRAFEGRTSYQISYGGNLRNDVDDGRGCKGAYVGEGWMCEASLQSGKRTGMDIAVAPARDPSEIVSASAFSRGA